MNPEVCYPLRIYYDASCPLCRAEMEGLKERDQHQRLALVDCSAEGFACADLEAAGIDVSAAMARIRAVDAEGRWFEGVDVFVLSYRAAGLSAFSSVLAAPRLRPIWDRMYPLVARYRYWLTAMGLVPALTWTLRRAGARADKRSQACARVEGASDSACGPHPRRDSGTR